MASRKQIASARRNIKKARKAWMSMSHAERKKKMPGRPYRVHTKRWHELVRALRRKGNVRNPESVATFKLGAKSFLHRKRRR